MHAYNKQHYHSYHHSYCSWFVQAITLELCFLISLVESPDEDDDGGRLGHGSDHTAGTDHTQEDEEGLLAAGTRALA